MNTAIFMLAIIAILTALSIVDKHLTFFAGTAWIWGSLQFFAPINVGFMVLGLGVGMYLIMMGVWEYIPDE